MQKRNNIYFDIPSDLGKDAGVEQLLAYNVSRLSQASKKLGKEMEIMQQQKFLTPEEAVQAARIAKETRPPAEKKHQFVFGHGKMTPFQAARTRLLARADLHEWALLDATDGMLDTQDIEEVTRKTDLESAGLKPPMTRNVILAPRMNRENRWVYYQNPGGTIRWMVQPDGCVYINAFVVESDHSRKRFLGVGIDPSGHIERSCWRVAAAANKLDTIIDFVDTIRSLEVEEAQIRRSLSPVFAEHPSARIKAEYIEDDGGKLWVFLDDDNVAADVKFEEDGESANVRFFTDDEEGLIDPTLLEALEPRINEVLQACGQSPLDLRIDS